MSIDFRIRACCEARVDNILSLKTLDEKISALSTHMTYRGYACLGRRHSGFLVQGLRRRQGQGKPWPRAMGRSVLLPRNTWSGVGGEPNGIDGMVFTFRYYLP